MANFTKPLILTLGSKGLFSTLGTPAPATTPTHGGVDVTGNVHIINYSDDYVVGTGDNDIIAGVAAATAFASVFTDDGVDTFKGAAGDDQYIVNNTTDLIIEVINEGNNDTVFTSVNYTLPDNVENIVVASAASAGITVTGSKGANILDGGQSSNSDTLAGGAGDDLYIVKGTTTGNHDKVIEAKSAGTDTVVSMGKLTIDLSKDSALFLSKSQDNIENVILMDGSATPTTGDSTKTVVGNALANRLVGNGIANNLSGGLGNDTLDGGVDAVADTLVGGLGDDTYTVRNTTDVVTELSNGGTKDTVEAYATYSLGLTTPTNAIRAEVENLTLMGIDAINGTGNAKGNLLMGNSGNNVLDGAAGNDTLKGGQGADQLTGGTGSDSMEGGLQDDTYEVDSTSDKVVESNTDRYLGGIDTVSSSISFVLPSNVENLTLTSTAITAKGNELDNVITGNSGNNTIDGLAGADTLSGGGGNDAYVVDSPDDIVIGDAGTDTVMAAVDFSLVAENTPEFVTVSFKDATAAGTITFGGFSVDVTLGMAADDVAAAFLDAESTDYVFTKEGAGVYVFTSITGGNVTNLVTDSTIFRTFAVTNGGVVGSDALENLTLTGLDVITGTGNTLANTITGNNADNTIRGGADADTLNGDTNTTGTGGNDSIEGEAGDDVINGNGGDDTLKGGATSNDSISGGEGNDTIDETADTSANKYLGGDKGDDTITGGSASDTISGGDNNDTLNGVAGDDSIDGGNNDDVISGGTGADFILGGAGNDAIEGDASTDNISGGEGNDTITGGVAKDTVTTGAGNDKVVFAMTGTAANPVSTDTTAMTWVTSAANADIDLYSDLSLKAASGDTIDILPAIANVGSAVGGTVTTTTGADFVTTMNSLLSASGVGFDTSRANDISAAVVTASGGPIYLAVDLNHDDHFSAADFVIEITGTSTYSGMTTATFV